MPAVEEYYARPSYHKQAKYMYVRIILKAIDYIDVMGAARVAQCKRVDAPSAAQRFDQ
jgi:hypothetical protein